MSSTVPIRNPILPGFNPDPSIIRVGEEFHVATSTFEWWPGVRLHRSRDLVHWELTGHALTRRSQLDMRGNPSSGGIWAPGLSHCDGVYHLVYTNVKNLGSGFVDAHNHLVTTTDITGEWSEPVRLNSQGFDPSLFHDEDGRKWLLNMTWNHQSSNKSGGILLQEYDTEAGQLIGESKCIFPGTRFEGTEAPHLYRRGEWYYLMTAEGGTGYGHVVTLARSRSIDGPYEVCPRNPILTSRDDPELPLQKAGHASLVEAPGGRWYLAYLCGRPLPGTRHCNLGRETALVEVCWTDDDWLETISGENRPQLDVDDPGLGNCPVPEPIDRDEFDEPELPLHFNTLREPADESWCSLSERPGWLRLRGRESPGSRFDVSLVARRLETFNGTFATTIDYAPTTSQQFAGLMVIYDERNFFLLRVSHDAKVGRCLAVVTVEQGRYRESPTVDIPEDGVVHLEARFDDSSLVFAHRVDGQKWAVVRGEFDAGILSDESCNGFTGTFVGMSAHDLTGAGLHADFDFFDYRRS
ncbi:MAG: glycoside hydrolase family 43 protein [Phycisphaerales bacterium]|nr:glycoside hydrolase family 43 protein [Phycisphaerales bacterium]